MDYKKMQISFFLSLLLLTLGVTLWIFQPYFNTVILALVLAIVFQPLFKSLLKGVKGNKSVASAITVILITVIILIPFLLLGSILVKEANDVYIYATTSNHVDIVTLKLQEAVQEYFPEFKFDLSALTKEFFNKGGVNTVILGIKGFLSSALNIIINFFILVFGLFYFLRDGDRFKKGLIIFSPLHDKYDRQILKKLTTAVNSVVKGQLLVALTQGVLSGIGFVIFGVPNPVLLGAITVIAALIPAVGVAFVIIPTVAYLFFIGSTLAWIGLALWGLLLVGLIDDFMRPKLVEQDINIHPMLIFLSVLGAISVFGGFGLLIGPLVLSLLFALLDIYKEEFKEYLMKK